MARRQGKSGNTKIIEDLAREISRRGADCPFDTAHRMLQSAGRLHDLAVFECNGFPKPVRLPDGRVASEWDEEAAKACEIEQDAHERFLSRIAKSFGAMLYIQGDPRGWPAYLYWPDELDGRTIDSCYSQFGVGLDPRPFAKDYGAI
jgi:hypothetical protein